MTTLQNHKISHILVGILSTTLLLLLFSFFGSTMLINWGGINRLNGLVYFETRIFYWTCLLLIWLYSIKVEKQNLLIWKEQNQKIRTYIKLAGVLFAIQFIGTLIIQWVLSFTHFNKNSTYLTEMINIFQQNKFLLVFTALTAGVTEELIFRGYLLPRLEIIFKNSQIAIILSSVLFGIMHYKYGTVYSLVGTFFLGLVFSYHYHKYRNIKILIVCHSLWDLVALSTLMKSL